MFATLKKSQYCMYGEQFDNVVTVFHWTVSDLVHSHWSLKFILIGH